MARIRTVKPSTWLNEDLASLPFETRLLFIGLWTEADREGRMEDRPRKLKAAIFPYDNGLLVDKMLDSLVATKFITRYEVDGVKYIQVNKFRAHQWPHHKEAESKLPAPPRATHDHRR